MIEVEISRDEDGRIQEVRWADPDDVEAAEDPSPEVGVTTLLHTAKVGLERYLKIEPEITSEIDQWTLQVKRDQLINREIDTVLETMLLGLREIERKYPDHLAVRDAASQVSV